MLIINCKMGTRLYEEFMKKMKVPLVQRYNKKQENKEIVIAIPLKGGSGVSLKFNLSVRISNYNL